MAEVELTVKQAARVLRVSERTIIGWIVDEKAERRRFPNAHLLYDSRKLGYRIPARDILSFITRANPSILEEAQTAIQKLREDEERQRTMRAQAIA